MKIYYTVYKTTNQINGKFYIGTHKTKDLNDKYIGSGKYLKHAIEKHGVENFHKEILFVFETSEEMFQKEAEIVNEDFLSENNTYNLKLGGFGGFDFINSSNEIVHKRNTKIHQVRVYTDESKRSLMSNQKAFYENNPEEKSRRTKHIQQINKQRSDKFNYKEVSYEELLLTYNINKSYRKTAAIFGWNHSKVRRRIIMGC